MGRGGGGGFDRRVAGGNSAFVNVGAVSSGYGSGQGGFKTSYRDQSNRLNADMFNGPAQEYDDDDGGDEHKDGSGSGIRATPKRRDVMPMGIVRREPKKKELVVASSADMVAKEKAAAGGGADTQETSSGGDGATPAEDVAMEDDGQVWPGAPTERKVKVRGSDGQEIEVTEIDDRRIQQRARSATAKDEYGDDGGGDNKAKVRAEAKYQSREDEVRADQLAMMLRELGPRAEGDSKDGRLYLFQLPPVMPPLRVVQRPDKKAKPKTVVKDEPVDEDGGVVTTDVGQTFDLTEGAAGATSSSSSGDGGGGGGSEAENDESNPYPDTVGYVGKMTVRRSGKVTLDWGGIAYSVMPGIQTSFLTNAVLLEDADKKPKSGEVAGRAYGMGKVMGRFVCRPVFREPVPWVVDPADLAEAKAEAEAKEVAKAKALEDKARLRAA
ncbi:hypothetical protein GGTG_06290 [Gaeumannomyces tritici R3-111a-1]|uniref:Uncharacterized protein n=1 Tax=Gaeumannomyces tritici (strain R3-111a-1) TaxID=644352 RepID=J3NYD7_GAET3|nr:hypothetical protein GGTG_06290 [Gaeumannomyces tritici R3-111a-1]EJT76370.1 hypothetical protein GGTG_06290 [Gaeumannomyces tritici R3-111a-1]